MFSVSAMVLALGLVTGAQTQVVRLGHHRPGRQGVERVEKNKGHVSPAELTAWAKRQLADEMPAGLRILDVSVAHGTALPHGAKSARLAFERELGPGVVAGQLLIHTPQGEQSIPLRVALAAGGATQATPVIKRGAEVMVLVRSSNVLVQSAGISQEAGAVGDRVSVLPQSSQRVVRGTVLDGRTVEVSL